VSNFVRFDAGILKLQQMIKWDIFLEHSVGILYVEGLTEINISYWYLVLILEIQRPVIDDSSKLVQVDLPLVKPGCAEWRTLFTVRW